MSEQEPTQEPAETVPNPSDGQERIRRWEPETEADLVEQAAAVIAAGSCLVLPTDTVYGIGADAFSAAAVGRLLEAKGRGRDMPPPVLIGDPAVMMALGTDIPDQAKALAERFWPGPLTLILAAQPSLRMDLGETNGTVAVRVPDHDFARRVLRRTGPMAVSSANLSGRPAATDAAQAYAQLTDRVELYLDAGPTPGSVPSTIVDFTRSDYGEVVRRGRISVDELREVVPYLADLPGEPLTAPPDSEASGNEQSASSGATRVEPGEPSAAGRADEGETSAADRADEGETSAAGRADDGASNGTHTTPKPGAATEEPPDKAVGPPDA